MNALFDWISGNLSSGARVFTAIAPALLLLAYALVGLVVYAVRNRLRGEFHDEEMDGRGLGGLTTARMRHFFAWLMRPFWQGLAKAEVPPNAITTLSVGLALGAGVALAAGRFALGGWLYLTAGALDFLDGRVARVTGRAGSAGAALDSVLDRYCESAVIVGLAWYYRDSWVLLPALLALTGSLFVPYVRARGEALGAVMKDVGFMQRPERIVVLGLTTAMSPILEVVVAPSDPRPIHRLAVAGLVLVAATSHTTAIQRLGHLVRTLGGTAEAGMKQLPRSVVTSVLATASDFAVVWVLVQRLAVPAPLATTLGCIVGGTVAFTLSRSWVFDAQQGARSRQALRFVFVSGTSALLNGGGVALLMLFPSIDYRIAWAVTRFVVFATWNYPLLRDYVFAPPLRDSGEHPVAELGPVSQPSRG
jgi:phosphatidylglycerophosphate synthase/putative flippase GtrA